MIDILVVGVSMRRGTHNLPELGANASVAMDETRPAPAGASRTGLGISAAGDLAQLTSHAR
jgi:hypothetical protein